MALDYSIITNEFIRVAREGVGDSLSTTGPTGSEFPSVIKARSGGTKPDYPYIQLDVLNTTKTSGWELERGVDSSDNPFIDTHYKILLQYTVYGGNAIEIAHNLESYFRWDRVLNDIHSNTNGKLEQTFDVISTPEKLATDYIEAAAFNLTFNILDRITDSATGVFDRIILDGDLARDANDPDPLDLDVDVGPI